MSEQKPRPTVGQQLFMLNVGDNARHRPQILTPVTVTKVGRKYFTTKQENAWPEIEWYLEDWREHSNYCPNWALFSSEQEWTDQKAKRDLLVVLRETFSHGGRASKLPLQTLQKINALTLE